MAYHVFHCSFLAVLFNSDLKGKQDMIWRCTMYINGDVDGWSESVYHRDGQNRAAAVGPAFEQIIAKRVRFLGAPYKVVAYKISAYSTNAGARPAQPAKYFTRKQFPTPGNSFSAEPGNVGCEINMVDQTLAISTRLTFGAPPDDCVNIGGRVDPAVTPLGAPANFGTMVADYVNLLSSNVPPVPDWGWSAVGSPQDRKIDLIVANLAGQIVLTPAAPNLVGLTPGTVYPARIRRINNGKSNLNGPLNVIYNADNTLLSSVGIALGASHIGGFVKVYVPVRQYNQYGGGDLALQSVKHVRGRPFGISRGRRPVKARA